MKVLHDEAWEAFSSADVGGTRIKHVRATPLKPGGRTTLTLFEQVGGDGRPHPRLQTSMPLPEDPATREIPWMAPEDPAAFEAALTAAIAEHRDWFDGTDLELPNASPRYFRNAIARLRRAAFFDRVRATAPSDAAFALAVQEDLAYAASVEYDDADTGTYHSFGNDAPFVHFLETTLETLPEEATEPFAALPPEQQESVRRQRAQARQHLDFLMRHKYAHKGIVETDIETSLGGLLVDRETRLIVSETEASRESLVPGYELLRIQPSAEHPHAGAWVYRDAEGGLRLQDDHAAVEGEPPVRAIPKEPGGLTFRRAPDDPHLRKGVRFDWNGDGYVQSGEIEWVSWAGHCDIKAVVECLGITLTEQPPPALTEHRTDTGVTTTWSRDLLLEMLCSSLELGSVYRTLDGSSRLMRGVHHFGGARNDSRPDRLQFQGTEGEGRHFRWPLTGRKEAFRVTDLEDAAFMRYTPADGDVLDFSDNPRFLKTVEGDYGLIDVSGMQLSARVELDVVDPETGYPSRTTETTAVDLRPDAPAGRDLLGTHVQDAAERAVFKVYVERSGDGTAEIVAELERWEAGEGGAFAPVPDPDEEVRIPLTWPLSVTCSREMKRDDPEVFAELLAIALREGRNINADTDMAAEVWNGTVTAITNERLAEDRERRTERWRVKIEARFGDVTLEYLLRRDEHGAVVATCPLPGRKAPDFLWQDFPDVGSKGVQAGEWIVNETMVERGIVEVAWQPSAPGGFYVFDDQVKNVYEQLFAALGGYPYTVVHGNKRYGFADEAAWKAAVETLTELRAALSFQPPP